MIDDLNRLWLATLEQVVIRAAHEVKDALNGVPVNLEVVRSRSAKPTATVEGVAPFAKRRDGAARGVAGPDRGTSVPIPAGPRAG